MFQHDSGSDDDGCEEWERHEALHDDPANVERNKERVFESEIELKWEKGGSGLVFYTDAQFWREKEDGGNTTPILIQLDRMHQDVVVF